MIESSSFSDSLEFMHSHTLLQVIQKCRIELLDNRVTVEDASADGGGDNGGSTPTTPSGGSGSSSDSGSKGDNTGQGGGSSSGPVPDENNEFV